MGLILFVVVILALSALVFCLYRSAVCRYDQRVIEEYEDRREQQRRLKSPSHPATETPLVYAAAPEDEEFYTECADVLAQLEQRRKSVRRAERLARR